MDIDKWSACRTAGKVLGAIMAEIEIPIYTQVEEILKYIRSMLKGCCVLRQATVLEKENAGNKRQLENRQDDIAEVLTNVIAQKLAFAAHDTLRGTR